MKYSMFKLYIMILTSSLSLNIFIFLSLSFPSSLSLPIYYISPLSPSSSFPISLFFSLSPLPLSLTHTLPPSLFLTFHRLPSFFSISQGIRIFLCKAKLGKKLSLNNILFELEECSDKYLVSHSHKPDVDL